MPLSTASGGKSRKEESIATNVIEAEKKLDNSLDVVTNAHLRQHAVLSPEGRTLSLLDKDGNTIWSNDVIRQIGANVPLYFRGRIDSMYVYGDSLVLLAGTGFFEIDKQTGEITHSGER